MGTNAEWRAREEHPFIPPRTKLALKLYVSGAARTQREAAEVAGVSSATVSNARRSLAGQAYEDNFDSQVSERSMSWRHRSRMDRLRMSSSRQRKISWTGIQRRVRLTRSRLRASLCPVEMRKSWRQRWLRADSAMRGSRTLSMVTLSRSR